MHLALVSKAARLLLAVSVSVWMAGGCLFGCSGGEVMAAEGSPEANEASAAVSGESCNRSRQHDCCTRPNAQKEKPQNSRAQIARRQNRATGSFAPERVTGGSAQSWTNSLALTGIPHTMKDCPLMTNGTAVTAKSNGNLPNPSHSSVADLPAIRNTREQTEFTLAESYLPNRGPTHLRCCVFRI